MKYFHLWHGFPPEQPEWGRPWNVEFDPPDVESMVKLRKGKELNDWNPRTQGKCPDASFSVDFTVASGRSWPIFSPRMKRVMESICPGDIQYLPFCLVNDPGKPKIANRTMYLGNVTTIVDCIDRVRTKVRNDDWTPRPNGTIQVRYPIWLKRSAMSGRRFFRVNGYFTPMIVREDIKEQIEAGDFRGVVFVREMPVSDD
ncbi:imm11 family protein [Aeoliella sp. SH292]|uniref:imm11 family protein n=1 Tax=Aeoliella sp. SH292 TaxID=3454464 RepID=UPI003F9AA92A